MSSSAAVDKSSAVAGEAGGNVSTMTASENSCTLIEDDAAMLSTVAAEDVTTTVFPSINSRLANLRPSKDLLDYYRAKIAQYDSEFEVLAQKLDAFKCGYQDQEKLAGEVRQREEEIGQLQKSLSDMQVFLFQEREQVLRLYAENDRLKLRELEDRKKIQHLLSLTGVECGGGDVTYFHKEPPSKVVIPQYRPQTHHLHNSFATNYDSSFSITSEVAASASENMSLRKAIPAKGAKFKDLRDGSLNTTSDSFNIPRGGGSSKPAAGIPKHQRQMIASQQHKFSAATKKTASGSASQKVKEVLEGGGQDVEILRLQIDALHAQMEDQAKLSKDQLTALLEDRKVRQEEWEVGMKREGNRVKELSKQLSQVQELLHEATKEHLQTKMATRQSETKWIHEKDRLMRELDHLKDKLSTSQHKKVEILSESVHDLEVRSVSQKDRIASLQVQLEQSQKLADMYREQIIQLEDEISRIREEGDIGKELFRERTDKMAKRLQLMNQRYESLEQRRNLEVEGFKNDIKLLRTRLKEVERQLYKVTLSFAEPLIREDKDLELLCDVKKTGKRTKAIMEDIHSLKAKIYGLEEDLRKA